MTDVTLANGNVRLAASIDGPMDAVPILLLHGASVSRDTWDETKQQLMDRYCVWTSIFVVTATLIARRITTSQVMSDAKAALAAIGRPAIVVGYSLWACVVRVLSQINPNVRAVFFEDPPWFLGRPDGMEQVDILEAVLNPTIAADEMAAGVGWDLSKPMLTS